ncbi:RING finger protein 223 [Collichthys lucidus]|uniref:RING finger protein 223 n=1 Tax=Collichthys lucidus TaxID=240159 RepID=A0A4U5VZ39_COLLU|nr:RING finger protein 223 [Collichthys lucidus]
MYSELECGICYRTYNAGRRCPRELQCKHSFCESCLLALSRPLGPEEARQGADRSIMCPLCRQTTSISGERQLRVDECVLERLLAAGVLDHQEDAEEADDGQVQDGCGDNGEEREAARTEAQAEESDSLAGSRGGRLRRTWRKVWRKISGKSSGQRGGENCMTSEDMRNLAMMSCYNMF